jgi:2-amino-4-hydroxy-6-hydroxymethyldihydropteridine diphosphokinase
MSLILSLGTNVGDLDQNLSSARKYLFEELKIICESPVVQSKAVDYTDQNNFKNQLLEFEIPSLSPQLVLDLILCIEKKMGRVREFKYGPRIIDIDIIFWGNNTYTSNNLQIPHPKYRERDFITEPFKTLPFIKFFSLALDGKPTKSIIKI